MIFLFSFKFYYGLNNFIVWPNLAASYSFSSLGAVNMHCINSRKFDSTSLFSSLSLLNSFGIHLKMYDELLSWKLRDLQVGVVATPDIHSFDLTNREHFIILGCDGLWGVCV
jgi:serine/threonine protein phosphatase PrpC